MTDKSPKNIPGTDGMSIDKAKLDTITDKVMGSKPKPKQPIKIAQPECEGELTIGDIVISCAVLEGGVRLISQRQFMAALGAKGKPMDSVKNGALFLPKFLLPSNLKPYINNEITAPCNFIEYQPKHGGRTAYGIRAEVLHMICEVFINAKSDGALKTNQMAIADKCRILQNGLARVGIVALVDEATGYEDIRAKNALAKILESYLDDEAKKWTQTFPLEFYKQIYRLKKWSWQALESGKKPPTPRVVGIYTDDFVYKRIAPGLLEELRTRNPDRRFKHHQWFNADRGDPKLRAHIASVIAVMKLSDTWEDCKDKMNKVHPLQWKDGTLFYKPDS